MRIPPPLKQRAAQAARLAMLSSTALAATATGNAQAAVPDGSVEARLQAIRAALAQQADSRVPTHAEAAAKLAQWPNGSGFRNGGWRNY
jgi:predicted transcriptional regulator